MSNKNEYWIPRGAVYLLAILIFIAIAWMCGGCEVLKGKHELKSDTTNVKRSMKDDRDTTYSGAVHKENDVSKEQYDWWRTTMQFALGKGDTTINKFYNPPATIIYEGGKGTKEENKESYDTTWYSRMLKMFEDRSDSMSAKIDRIDKDKHSQTKGLGLMTIILIGVGLIVLYHGIRVFGSKYKITKSN